MVVVKPGFDPIVAVRNLQIAFRSPAGEFRAVDDITFSIEPGQVVALVGESGSGKTMIARSLLRVLPPEARVAGGEVHFDGLDLLACSEREMGLVRGRQLAMVLQDPMGALNPVLSVGRQITEVLEHTSGMRGAAARERALELLRAVGLPAAPELLQQYPHQLSGGMRQRVLMAQALAGNPRLLIADEPTTALDMRLRTQVLDLLDDLRHTRGLAVLLITHDLGAVSGLADRVVVMYAGQVMEAGPASALLKNPIHPYTQALLAAVPRMAGGPERLESVGGQPPDLLRTPSGCPFHPRCPRAEEVCRAQRPPTGPVGEPGHEAACWHPKALRGAGVQIARVHSAPVEPQSVVSPPAGTAPVLSVKGLVKEFRSGHFLSRRIVRAVDGVSFDLQKGETLALVGESGSGKTTLGRTVLRLYRPTMGEVHFLGAEISRMGEAALTPFRRQIGAVFQDPAGSLNPRLTVADLVMEPMWVAGLGRAEARGRVEELLALVGLGSAYAQRLPHQLSGGQRQRVGIARALALNPQLVVLDEPVSALDVSVQAQVINLLADLQKRLGLSYLFITHDLALSRYLADRVAVMYQGSVVEIGPTADVLRSPNHWYSRALVAAANRFDPDFRRVASHER